MIKRDYYEVLGISKTSDEVVIKSAYRKMAMQYHPDRNPGNKEAEDKFKECTEAYEVLKDPQKRQTYDQFGHAGVGQGGGFGGFGGFDGFDLSDALRAFMRDFGGGGGSGIFEEFFGGASRGRSNRGEDLRVKLKLTLEEIASGVERTVKLTRQQKCETCDGSGVAAGSSRKTCTQCRGKGQVRRVTQTFLGTVQQVTTCNLCRGTGEVISDPCKSCRGEGRLSGQAKVNVKVPPGVATGNYMTIEGMGNAAPHNGLAGDLQVIFEEEEHSQFTRHGDNLIHEFAIPFTLAALGGEIFVPTLQGQSSLKIPAGTQSGKVFKVKGKGLPRLHRSGHGDLLVQVIVWVPTGLSAEDKRTLEQLAQSETFKPPQGDKTFFGKLRETLGV